ncbi:dipeptide/oligopeptide/nickel ABC transporter permease/ATP-binding protein [Mycolicibacterium obuense]|uniref:Dipeptide/oligopeptide/nickel ABC transporter permease/ATP-binding protein n=3 Tax=Mycolicibacterium TaxID=1866885 RepID=A0A4R5X0X0_9MYCO|nr:MULTISPECIES: dipeptide/oligopeptide/nickel ABC transporter permease/ATP-binding protein [Mycolicibacterium]MCV7022763.1 dipeptide/oligopeptide/nickel ABC transporter permease/ATP-binding protein [Mycolicibacterium novocastrense]NVN52413.1 ABC transporter, permease protein 2 (cluster 5, nickel/peptides/opines) [Mycolicibacterium hippocampi]TDL03821.1 dipeptide/oligopeptide/nickel ABC transporter permease/ATP-binding protein [Mycolicibacterium obuense]GAT10336.1 glutathione import ATP-binding
MRTRSRRLAMVGLALLGVLVFVALAAPLLAPYAPSDRVGRPFSAPSAAHLLGTNDVGHDLLSELIYGARISLLVGIVAALAATVIGASVGLLAGYARGWVDTVLMRFVDVVLALPVLPLTIVIGVFAGPGLITQVIVISAVIWAGISRELRAQVLSLRERDHIQALRAMGAGAGHVLPRHILPAVAPLLVPQFVLATKSAILLEASLAFLGLGDITAKSWGSMLSNAHARSAFLTDAWLWWVVPPGLVIALTVLAFALLGYAFEERARPSLRDGQPPRSAPTRAAGPVDLGAPPLVIENLTVTYQSDRGVVTAVDGLSVTVEAGELVGVVGESGSGKSTVTAAAIALLPPAATVIAGTVAVQGRDLATLTAEELRALRGDRIALVPQDAISALNPVRTVRAQLAEAVRAHRSVTRATARARADELLNLVGLDPARAGSYPHQFSGGMCQRVVIAMALINDPAVVIADEPTSGLDGVVQGEILDLLDDIRHRLNLALLIVSHDLSVVGRIADRIAVMQAGRIVEVGPTEQVLTASAHPFTRSLVDAVPRLTTAGTPA